MADQGSLFSEPSWAELVRHYEATYLTRTRKGTSRTRKSILKATSEWTAVRKITHPGAGDWVKYFGERVTSGELMRSTVNAHRKVISHVYEWARDCEEQDRNSWRLLRNPLAGNRVPKWEEPIPRPSVISTPAITVPQILGAMPDPLGEFLISVLYRHGLRIQEALALEPRHLDFVRHTIRIEQQREAVRVEATWPKTKFSVAVLPLHPESEEKAAAARRWLMAHPRRGAAAERYLLPVYRTELEGLLSVCRSVSPADFPKRVVGVDGGAGWHVFRHTFALELVTDLGLSIAEAHDWLRHASPATTVSYYRILLGRSVGDVDRMRERWASQAQSHAKAREIAKPGLKLISQRRGGDHD